MNIVTTVVEAVTVVRLEGNLDTSTSELAQNTFNELVDGGAQKIPVNLADVGFVSSSGLRVLLSTAKRLGGPGGNLRISNLNDTVSEVFEISGFSTILGVFPTEEMALEGF
jgi:anti-sigma B factor antagonist